MKVQVTFFMEYLLVKILFKYSWPEKKNVLISWSADNLKSCTQPKVLPYMKDFEDLFSWIKDICEDVDGLEEVHQNKEHRLLRYDT